MTWEPGPVLEKTEKYEARLVRKGHVPGVLFTGDRALLAKAAELKGEGPPWLAVLDAGDGWLVTELDLSVGVGDLVALVTEDPRDPLAAPVLAAAKQAMTVAVRRRRDPHCLRFDWRGGMRLRPVAEPGGALEPVLRALTPDTFATALPWDETRVMVFAMAWLAAHFAPELDRHRDAEAWIELPAAAALEQAVVEHLDDEAPWRVLADALLEQGHPRGALMALQLGNADATATRNELRRHPWLLPLAGPSLRLVLERGFVARMDVSEPQPLERMLRHPALRFLKAIHFLGRPGDVPMLLAELDRAGHRSVRELVLPRVQRPERHLEKLQRALPRLQRVINPP